MQRLSLIISCLLSGVEEPVEAFYDTLPAEVIIYVIDTVPAHELTFLRVSQEVIGTTFELIKSVIVESTVAPEAVSHENVARCSDESGTSQLHCLQDYYGKALIL